MKRTLSTRLTYHIMAVVLVMMAVITGVVYHVVKEYMLEEAKQRYESILLDHHEELRRHLTVLSMATRNNLHDIERDIDHPDLMFSHVERIVKQNPNIVCCTILFEPDLYPSKGRLFVPYARRNRANEIKVERIDSTYRKYYLEDWYITPMKEDRDNWVDVYFESSWFAGDDEPRLLTTYTIPIHNHEGRPVALLCADLSLEWLRHELLEDVERVNRKFEKNEDHKSYSFVIDRKGTYIVHPDKERMLKDTLAADCIMDGERGATVATIDGVPSWIYYRTVQQLDWTMAIAVPKDVMLSNGSMLNIIILLVMLAGLLVIYLFCRQQIKEIADPVAAQKAAMDRELMIAHDIQMSMLPKMLNSQSDLFASLTPARDVGGDLYDYFIRDNSLYFCIGDVAGKGVPAALVMATACSAFRLLVEKETRPERIVSHMNDMMNRNNEMSVFVTFFMGIIDLNTGHLSYCNAGHKAPYIIKEKGEVTILPVDRNLPVGAMPDWEFTAQEAVLEPGATLFLYTDGLDEAENAQRQMFGKDRIKKVLQCTSPNPHVIIEQMTLAVADFVAGNEQSDDLTMLSVRY